MTATQRITQYFKESRTELQKVQWPTREETIRNTLTVIGVSFAMALFLAGIDFVFNLLLQKLLNVA